MSFHIREKVICVILVTNGAVKILTGYSAEKNENLLNENAMIL